MKERLAADLTAIFGKKSVFIQKQEFFAGKRLIWGFKSDIDVYL